MGMEPDDGYVGKDRTEQEVRQDIHWHLGATVGKCRGNCGNEKNYSCSIPDYEGDEAIGATTLIQDEDGELVYKNQKGQRIFKSRIGEWLVPDESESS